MSVTQLETSVRHTDRDVAVIDLKGDVTAASEAALMDAYREASRDEPRGIALNFSDLDYMNSGGIGLLVTLLVRAKRAHQQVTAFGLSDHYRQIFELTRIDEVIGVHPDERHALDAARLGARVR
ncbi:STAS domain-containing protein [Blastococcus saxobsidens]|uniref:Anti-anti-sigma factor n=1 Tax=Blastococcus saxobsidens TaxID=138336 RepID=A0A4Q7Y4M7_9ACTN|nr:STAS domain-containing protein [Blastococcus saxobsidens]RZU30799.1 anti-anti-sigma factor [Blastococcus saxobsidens]